MDHMWWGRALTIQRPLQGSRSWGPDPKSSMGFYGMQSPPCVLGALGLVGQAKMENALAFLQPVFWASLSPLGLGSTSLFLSFPPLVRDSSGGQLLPPIDIESGKDFTPGLFPSLPPFFQYLVFIACQGRFRPWGYGGR